jgi:fatty-acyl-CoA synthase
MDQSEAGRRASPFEAGLERRGANYAPLTPLQFLDWAAATYPDHTSVIHGELRHSWNETYARCRRLASALIERGIGPGDTVAVMAPNVPAHLEAHFGVPMAGAVLNALNYRLDSGAIAHILDHAEAKVLMTDREFAEVMAKALEGVAGRPLVIDIDDPLGTNGPRLGETTYEELLAEGEPDFAWSFPEDEWQAISLNYTSGTTGEPKGTVYSHRGAYLNAIGNVITWSMPARPVYLWTLPMFHCNGWCFPWSVTALAGTHVCLRKVDARAMYAAIADHEVTHLCGAPIVLNMLINASPEERRPLAHPVHVMTAAAPPPPKVLERIEAIGFKVTHVYGLTETYGPATVCAWHPEWDALGTEARAALKARQGVRYLVQEGLMVADPTTLVPVPWDGKSLGEVFFRGNITMKGYFKDPQASAAAFEGGWFHTSDLAVVHADGYIQLKDRSKDIIISGGENVSTIEVEGVIYQHPAVLEAAVVARPDEKWGETPCAFVTLKPGANLTDDELVAFCRDRIAHFKCPKTVVFTDLPKTSTGKIQKFVLRRWAAELAEAAKA